MTAQTSVLQARDPQAILATLLAAAKKAGADAADALFVEGVSSSVSYRLGKLEDVERAEANDLGLRVFVGQLRNKIEHDPANPRFVRTEPGVGYRFAE